MEILVYKMSLLILILCLLIILREIFFFSRCVIKNEKYVCSKPKLWLIGISFSYIITIAISGLNWM